METTHYYERRVRSRHPEPIDEWVDRVLANPYHSEEQSDGRVRYYGFIEEQGKWLRVVLAEGKLHNRFFDRGKLREWGRP